MTRDEFVSQGWRLFAGAFKVHPDRIESFFEAVNDLPVAAWTAAAKEMAKGARSDGGEPFPADVRDAVLAAQVALTPVGECACCRGGMTWATEVSVWVACQGAAPDETRLYVSPDVDSAFQVVIPERGTVVAVTAKQMSVLCNCALARRLVASASQKAAERKVPVVVPKAYRDLVGRPPHVRWADGLNQMPVERLKRSLRERFGLASVARVA